MTDFMRLLLTLDITDVERPLGQRIAAAVILGGAFFALMLIAQALQS